MATIDIREFTDSFVIHFGTEAPRINAYTLATALVALADTAKAVNASINPGYELEIVVEALGSGSFRTRLKGIYRGAGNLFSAESLRAIVISVMSAYIYTHTLEPDKEVKVVVNTSEVIIEQGDSRIVVPRNVYETTKVVEQSSEFRAGVTRVFQAIERDPTISYVSVSHDEKSEDVGKRIPRERFSGFLNTSVLELPEAREVIEVTEIQITRAILERGRKRWQFVWRGVRISAPVLDDRFYDKFFAHEITIAPGDSLQVRLRVRQQRDPDSGILINDPQGYEVREVLQHRPRGRQQVTDFLQ